MFGCEIVYGVIMDRMFEMFSVENSRFVVRLLSGSSRF